MFHINNGAIALRVRKNQLSDFEHRSIEVLNGVDLLKKLYTLKMKTFSSGVHTIETRLLCIIYGRADKTERREYTTTLVTSMLVKDNDIKNL